MPGPDDQPLIDNTGGVASGTFTLVDQPAAYTEATHAAHLATIAAKINEIIAELQNRGILS